MRVSEDTRIPTNPADMARVLQYLFREYSVQLNGISEGKIAAVTNAYAAVPTAGDFVAGDFVRNSAPAEAGSPGSKYVITGWICTDDSPLTFLECRSLTGN